MPTLRRHPLLNGRAVALLGVSTVVRDEVAHYFEIGKPKYRMRHEALALPGLTATLNSPPPPGAILRPVLAARVSDPRPHRILGYRLIER